MNRRTLLKLGGLASLAGGLPMSRSFARAGVPSPPEAAADYTIRIGTGLIELAPDRILSTTTYNGQFPGPLLRFKEGQPVTVDIHNDTDTPEQLHWHGQFLPTDVDGSAEEGTPFVPARGTRVVHAFPEGTSLIDRGGTRGSPRRG